MKNWNLRTLVLLRAFCMIWIPLLAGFYSLHPVSLFQLLILLTTTAVLLLKDHLDRLINGQMDECAQALMDRLTRRLEAGLTSLAVMGVFLLAILGTWSQGHEVEMSTWLVPASQILAWCMVILHVIRGVAFCVLDRKEGPC